MIVALIASVTAVLSFFLWTTIHELAHLLVAKALVNAELLSMKVWPHVDEKAGFRWGAVRWQWTDRQPTDNEHALILFAPRLPGLLAAVGFPLTALAQGHAAMVLAILVGAGLVDLANGSLGISEHSDLKRGAAKLQQSPWLFRSLGFLVVLSSVAAWFFFRK